MTGADGVAGRWGRRALAGTCLIAVVLLGVAGPAHGAGSQNQIRGDSWIVTFGGAGPADTPRRALSEARDRSLDRAADRALSRLRITPTHRYRRAIHGFAAQLTPAQVRALHRDPTVRSVTPDRRLVIDEAASPRNLSVDATEAGGIRTVNITSQRIPSGIRRVRADDSPIADIDRVDERIGVDVAVLDTGIDAHPDLNVRGGHDCLSSQPDAIRDRNGHGTHVAGIIGAIDDGEGVVGVAPGARLWAVRVADDNGRAKTSWYLCGVEWVMSRRDPSDSSKPLIEVVNMSVSGLLEDRDDRDCGVVDGSVRDPLHKAICASVADGTTYVVAAGNQSTDAATRLPAGYDEVITVSAMADYDGKPGGLAHQSDYCPWYSADSDDSYGDFSNYGPDVDMIAPGKCILSTYLRGKWGLMTGTSMATPTVAGAAALFIAANPGVRPGQVRAALRHVGSQDWKTGTDPDDTPDRLLDVSSFDDPPTFVLDAAGGDHRLGRGGRLEVPITLDHRNGHTRSVTMSAADMPEGVDASFRDGLDGVQLLVLRASDDIEPADATMTVRGTDGELSRSVAVDFRLAGGPRIDFSAPTGGPLVVDPGTDVIPVAFTESGGDPASRRIQRQWAPVRSAGSCGDVKWRDDGGEVPPDDLDPGGSSDDSWSFDVDPTGLPEGDGCYRWLAILTNDGGDRTMWVSGAALVDGSAPDAPNVRATGSRVYQSSSNKTVWVRAGSGTVELTASGRGEGAGVAETQFGPLSKSAGWDPIGPPVVDGDPASKDLDWSSAASGTTTLAVSSSDVMGLGGPSRTVTIKVDGTDPSGASWIKPSGFYKSFGSPELRWRSGRDGGSGWAQRQAIQRQRARVVRPGSCTGLSWSNDGAARLMSRPSEAVGLTTGYCYRWRITALDRVGNRGPTRTSGVVLHDGRKPTGNFRSPNEGSTRTQTGSRFRLTWTESESGGAGGLSRALERERKRRASDGTCAGRMWRLDGSTLSVRSGYTATGLNRGYCYRWRLILEDGAGNVTTVISGVVKRRP